jgi:phosphoribosyl-dephospho-CoA transferase
MPDAAVESRDLPRHTLAWIAADARSAVAASARCDRDTAMQWLAQDFPLIVRRADARDSRDFECVALGLPLPPSLGKRRIALSAPRSAIARAEPPPAVEQLAPLLPVSWQTALEALSALAAAAGITFRAVGSAAWQALTALPYLHPDSDLDLVWRPRDERELAAGIALLEEWEHRFALRADGEIVFPGDHAVSWREWRDAGASSRRVLVKTLEAVKLARPAELLARLGAACR